jgi:hypothetical protein
MLAVPEFRRFSEMIEAFVMHPTPYRIITFAPGKLGRVDLFWLEEFTSSVPVQRIGQFQCDTPEATLAVLRVLDDAVTHHPEVCFYKSSWHRFANKGEQSDEFAQGVAATLYMRRIYEQSRICDGKLKRGHKAFGFYPLDGYR